MCQFDAGEEVVWKDAGEEVVWKGSSRFLGAKAHSNELEGPYCHAFVTSRAERCERSSKPA